MIDYVKLAQENKEWAVRNFGDKSTKENSYFGIIEELGELSHIILKERQGIREGTLSPEEIKAMKADAIADCAIYLLNWYAFFAEDRPRAYPLRPLDLDEILDIPSEFHLMELAMKCLWDFDCFENSSWFLAILYEFAHIYDINFEQNLLDTWNKVKQRDFIKFPGNGMTC